MAIVMTIASACSVADEDVFGPIVDPSCRNGFDFTLLFEELILTQLPISIFFIAAFARIWVLRRASEKVNRSWLYAAKEVRLLILEPWRDTKDQ